MYLHTEEAGGASAGSHASSAPGTVAARRRSYWNTSVYSLRGSRRTFQTPSDSADLTVWPPDWILAIRWPCGGRIANSPATPGRSEPVTALPPFQDESTSTLPRARSPWKWPSGQAEGSAGRIAITPE